MKPLLEVRKLSRDFHAGHGYRRRPIRVVQEVDLQLFEGEALGLAGESGSGKTTLARCALHLLRPSSGSVFFDGIDIGTLNPRDLRLRRREFQMIFQVPSASLDPRMTVAEILREPYEIQGLGTELERKNWVEGLMESVALDFSLADRRPASLSGGQQQRVVIARALALKPRLLVADEPISALDASVGAQILNLLAELRHRFQLTLLLISHSLPVVQYLCDRIAVMYLGRIVEESPARNFRTSARHPYSLSLLESVPGMRDASSEIRRVLPGEIASAADPPPGCHFHPRCPKVLEICRREHPKLLDVGEQAKVRCFLYL